MKAKPKKYVVMCVGYTHTGKTTFAKKLVKDYPNTILVDNDEIALFLKEKYPLAVLSPYNKIKRSFKKPNFKFLIFKDIYDFSLHTGLNIVLSNGNLAKDIRSLISRKAKNHGYTLVTVYFDLPSNVILERLQNTKKSTKMFAYSTNWSQIIDNQKRYAELPPSKKNTVYFEIKNDSDSRITMKELGKLLPKQ